MPLRRLLAAIVLAAALGVAAQAHAQVPPVGLTTTTDETGWIGASVAGAPGTQVTLSESGQALRRVTIGATGTATVRHLVAWGCSGFARTIVASVAGTPAAAVTVATPSCAGRFTVSAPRSVRAG